MKMILMIYLLILKIKLIRTNNIFSSKEEFINYAKDVLNSTFKGY